MGYAEIRDGKLVMRFPEIGEDCELRIGFHRTLRVPDDNREYPLPPSLGLFGLEHVDDHLRTLPAAWGEHGGIALAMWQSEALWLSLESPSGRPFAVKVAAGKVSAVTGKPWRNELGGAGGEQDYLVAPDQPWIDGFCVAKGKVRQFVAMPMGAGYTAEEQITGKAEFGGLQIVAYPMREEKWTALRMRRSLEELERMRSGPGCWGGGMFGGPLSSPPHWNGAPKWSEPWSGPDSFPARSYGAVSAQSLNGVCQAEMGLAPGGALRQRVMADPHGIDAWETRGARCYAHILNAEQSLKALGKPPAGKAPSAAEYAKAGLPWFEHYAFGEILPGSEKLGKLQSVASLGIAKGEEPLPENEPASIGKEALKPTGPLFFGQHLAMRKNDRARDGKW